MQLWAPGGRLLAACPTAGQKYSYVIRKNLGANPSGPRCRLGGPRCRALGPRWEEAGGGVPYCWPEMAATAPSLPRPDPHPLPSVGTSVITYHHHRHRHHHHRDMYNTNHPAHVEKQRSNSSCCQTMTRSASFCVINGSLPR